MDEALSTVHARIMEFITPAHLPHLRLVPKPSAASHPRMRKILKSDSQPLEIKPQEKSVWICMCGLSKNQPYCDGSHKKIAGEEDGRTYEYDAEGHRREV
jgi:CDGSH iron-sulfur domain-containing protein 3